MVFVVFDLLRKDSSQGPSCREASLCSSVYKSSFPPLGPLSSFVRFALTPGSHSLGIPYLLAFWMVQLMRGTL